MSLSLTYLRRSRGWHVLFTPRKRFCFYLYGKLHNLGKFTYACAWVGWWWVSGRVNEQGLVALDERAQLQLTFTWKYVRLEKFARKFGKNLSAGTLSLQKSCKLNLPPLCCVSRSVTSVFMFSFRLMFRDTFFPVLCSALFYSNAVMTHTQ